MREEGKRVREAGTKLFAKSSSPDPSAKTPILADATCLTCNYWADNEWNHIWAACTHPEQEIYYDDEPGVLWQPIKQSTETCPLHRTGQAVPAFGSKGGTKDGTESKAKVRTKT